MAEELLVTLTRSDAAGFGFSLLGTAGLPHVIYDIVENSPAAESGKVEAGDVILRVNEVDVNRFTTKEGQFDATRRTSELLDAGAKLIPAGRLGSSRDGRKLVFLTWQYSIIPVLKCLRLSSDPVTLKLRRDPAVKAHVRRLLSPGQTSRDSDPSSRSSGRQQQQQQQQQQQPPQQSPPTGPEKNSSGRQTGSREDKKSVSRKPGSPEVPVGSPQAPVGAAQYAARSNGTCSDASGSSEFEALLPPQLDSFKEEERAQWEPLSGDKFARQKNTPRFEAYMMTGDLMLNLSRTQQSTGLLPKYQKKVDSLRYNNHHHAHHHHNNHHNSHHHHHHHHHNSVPTSPSEMLGHNRPHKSAASANTGGSNSATTSPVGMSKREGIIAAQCGIGGIGSVGSGVGAGGCAPPGAAAFGDAKATSNFGYSSGFVRTSRSEDHLQFQKDPSMSAVDIDIDDDVTSSLNTLLDTRPDSGGPGGGGSAGGVSSERIVWTYNAPVSSPSASERTSCCQNGSSSQSPSGSSSSSSSSGSTEGTSSPQRSLSPASPTSVSSSVMSSNSGSRRFPLPSATCLGVAAAAAAGGGAAAGDSAAAAAAVAAASASAANSLNAGSNPMVSSGGTGSFPPTNGDLSQSEAISNMSSPDYNDEETMDILSARDIMMVSDPSDSDSTILASEPPQRRLKKSDDGGQRQRRHQQAYAAAAGQESSEHRIVIQVKGPDKETNARNSNSPRQPRRRGNNGSGNSGGGGGGDHAAQTGQNSQRNTSSVSSGNQPEFCGYQELKESEDEFVHVGAYDEQKSGASPPQSADEESDIESLHSFHYSPKAVDLPSAVRLAKRLYSLDGFKKSDVSRHLSKNNDFSRAVAEEYLRYFSFERDTLDVALRKFLYQFSLTGETQERERVLVHFSKRYLDCNPGSFNSQDAVHTLTCAIMLLNTDLHGQNIGRKMSCSEFIENLSELNDGDNFPREVLKQLYTAIKSFPLEWALDEEGDDTASQVVSQGDGPALSGAGNPFLDVPNVTGATEFKKGYVMRKSCYDANGKKTPFGKRGWKMYYCTLRELVLYLHKDEHGFRNDSLHNAIRIHHALATKASDYTKKQHVFRLQTADQAEYLFQTSDSKELQSWIDTINFVCASFSCQPLAGAREQLRDHEERVNRLEAELDEHRRHPAERGAKALTVQNYKEKDAYLHYELKRYKTYAYLLRSRLAFTDVEPSLVDSCIGEVDEGGSGALLNAEVALVPPPVPDRPATNRDELDTS